MDNNAIKLLVDAGAIKSVSIVADGASIHALITTIAGTPQPATTQQGKIKMWSSIDSAAKYIRSLGIGKVRLDLAKWNVKQKGVL